MRRWLALLAYTALVYGLLPYGPAIGRATQQSAIGRWCLGGGAIWLVVAGGLGLVGWLRQRSAPASAYALLLAAVAGYALGLGWLHVVRLERVHLLEYGVASWLAWRALVPVRGERGSTYVLAAALAALVGWGDELVQSVTPGRFYDLRDVAANAAGAGLGALVIAVCRAGRAPSDGSS